MSASTHPEYLVVDLDGTLIRTDLLYESALSFLSKSPINLFLVANWLLRGRSVLKRRLAERVAFNPAGLPFSSEVLGLIESRRGDGVKIVLATASDQELADKVASHLSLFDLVLGSSEECNLKGHSKLLKLKQELAGASFSYIGDSRADFPIWNEASEALATGPKAERLRKKAAMSKEIEIKVVGAAGERSKLASVVKALRPHQWVKNFLIFIPLFLAHRWSELNLVIEAALAFCVFSLTASSVYVLNDLCDIEADRLHPYKKKRPFASGALSVMDGVVIGLLLLFVALGAGYLLLPLPFLLILSLYFVITSAYSFKLKKIPMVDVVTLAILYCLRLFAGGEAVEVPVSQWLLMFAMFLFLSLAFVKRYTELADVGDRGEEAAAGRGYRATDLPHLLSFGAVSGYLSVLVLALYIHSQEVSKLYTQPLTLLLLCPLLLFWISRVWLLAHRGEIHHDPIVFAIKDRVSYLVAFIAVMFVLSAV